MLLQKKIIWQQKKDELETEISTLEEILNREKKMHDILVQIQKGDFNSRIHIPSYIPPKMKEVLQDLSVAQEEITQLESQIRYLQDDLKQEQDATKKSKSKELKPNPPNPYPTSKDSQEKVEYETKALHFISKAMNGDYDLRDFSLPETIGQFSRSLPDYRKENHFPEVSRKSGAVKPASPLRTPKRERKVEMTSQSNLISPEEIHQKWQPNKLSESIMRCLMFIFVRLIRTSRTMELEKVRAANSSPDSINFWGDTGTNSKPSGVMLQRESKQQDPYGIFESESSIPRDIGPYKNFVIFTSTSLDPKCISNSSSITLLEKLRGLMNNLQKVDLRFLTSQQRLAFWINMYNASIMHGFLQYGVPSSPKKLPTLLNKASLNIGGKVINAEAIEHFILRKPGLSISAKEKTIIDEKQSGIHDFQGLESSDLNISYGLCCGTRSSPAVRIYTGEGVTAELEKSKVEYLQASIIVRSAGRIAFPELLLQNQNIINEQFQPLLKWVCEQLPTSGSLRKSLMDCLKTNKDHQLSTIVERIPYNSHFQYLLPV